MKGSMLWARTERGERDGKMKVMDAQSGPTRTSGYEVLPSQPEIGHPYTGAKRREWGCWDYH